MPEPTISLSQEQIHSFHEDGFLVLNAITTQEEVAQLREIYDRLFFERTGWDQGSQFDLAGTDEDDQPRLPQLLGPSRFAPELKDTLYLANARAIARQLLGSDMLDRNGEHMIYKPPRIGAATPWHQDQAYHDPELTYKGVNFWMPLDDATVESGCLQFIPGSHKLDVLPHHSINRDPRIHGLEVDNPEQYAERAVPCPVAAGGASLHACYMLHYAEPNHTDVPRRAYTLTFRTPPQNRDKPVDAYWQKNKQTARQTRADAYQTRGSM